MLERRIDAGKPALIELVLPARFVGVGLLLGIPPREHAGRLVERIPLVDDERRVRKEPHVLVVIPLVGQRVVDQPAEKRDVGAGANLDEAIGDGSRPVEARIDAHQLGVAVPPRFHHEPEADRVVLSRVAAHRQDDVRVADVGPAVGHCASSERGGQTGHRGAVSYSGLLLERDHAQPGSKRLDQQVVQLVGVGAAADDPD